MVTTSSTISGPVPRAELGFAARLRARTQSAHSTAEGDGALTVLINGAGDRTLYRVLLAQLQFVYGALEATAEKMRADPVAAPFIAPELTRLPALQADLVTLAGPDWAATTAPLDQTQRYVDRLNEVAATCSAAFVAHHYTRYLGDLSGGFAVGSAVRRHLGLEEIEGRRFFVFDQIPSPKRFKDGYRQLLDDAPWSSAERDLLVDETLLAYRLNTDLQFAIEREGRRQRLESESGA